MAKPAPVKAVALPPGVQNFLVVDGRLALMSGLQSELLRLGAKVHSTANPDMALPLSLSIRPEVVLLDADFGAPSLALCRKLVAVDHPVVVVMTGREPSREELLHMIQAGAADFLVKPFKNDAAIRRLLQTCALVFGGDVEGSEGGSAPERLRDALQKAKATLALPHAVAKITSLCSDPKANASDFIAPLNSDPGTAAALLKVANSVAFAKQGGIRDVRDAVVRMGMKNTRNSLLGVSVFKMVSPASRSAAFNRLWHWQHSLATAVLARRIAAASKTAEPEDGFIAGLLHGIGKSIMDDFAGRDFQQAVRKSAQEGRPLHHVEKEIFKANHAEAGAILLYQWQLPREMVNAVLHQHDAEPPEDAPLARILGLASAMSKAMFIGNSGDFLVTEPPAGALDNLNVETLRPEIEKEMSAFFAALEMPEASRQCFAAPIPGAGRVVWKTARRPLLGLFLSGAGFVEAGDAPPVLGVVSTAEAATAADARKAFEGFTGPILLLDSGPAEGVIPVPSPYPLLSLHGRITAALAPKAPPPPPEPPPAPAAEKKPAPEPPHAKKH